jgi:hypothetical protein
LVGKWSFATRWDAEAFDFSKMAKQMCQIITWTALELPTSRFRFSRAIFSAFDSVIPACMASHFVRPKWTSLSNAAAGRNREWLRISVAGRIRFQPGGLMRP